MDALALVGVLLGPDPLHVGSAPGREGVVELDLGPAHAELGGRAGIVDAAQQLLPLRLRPSRGELRLPQGQLHHRIDQILPVRGAQSRRREGGGQARRRDERRRPVLREAEEGNEEEEGAQGRPPRPPAEYIAGHGLEGFSSGRRRVMFCFFGSLFVPFQDSVFAYREFLIIPSFWIYY